MRGDRVLKAKRITSLLYTNVIIKSLKIWPIYFIANTRYINRNKAAQYARQTDARVLQVFFSNTVASINKNN